MIINTGCRTDIPAFYSKWLINRIREGYVFVRNPYNPLNVTKYSLSPDVVDCLAFCTKNPEPMLKYLDELDKYKQYWFVTITPYGKDIEPDKFATNLDEKQKNEFIFSFFPLMYGIYPYAVVTDKQKEAMEKADVPFEKLTIYDIAYRGILKLLSC